MDKKEIEKSYYKAYEERYRQVYKQDFLWFSKENTPDVIKIIEEYSIGKDFSILEVGCGEGRDAIYLLERGYQVLAVDYSKTVIDKCKQLTNHKYDASFRQLDIITDTLDEKYDFIYSVAVIHMFVSKVHRKAFYQFIYNSLKEEGKALIFSMGDGKKQYESSIEEAFSNVKRKVSNNQKEVEVVATSCKMVDWDTFLEELAENNLMVKKKWITNTVSEFSSMMAVVVSKKPSN